MRSSPINNIRNNRDYTSSPYESKRRGSPLRESPERARVDEGDYWKSRARKLQSELMAINEELLFQVRKNEKVDDLEEKIELLLAQNTHFVDENENLIRLVQQKNSEIEVWKKKFDSEFNHSNMAEAEKKRVFEHLNIKDQEHQFRIEKLLAEITRLENEAVETHNAHQIEVHQLKNRYESQAISQIQNLKRSQHTNHQLQEITMRKLKDAVGEKTFEIENLRKEMQFKDQAQAAALSFNSGESKRLQQQHSHQLKLLNQKQQNEKKNLIHNHRKNQEETKNLTNAKITRLMHEIQEKKNSNQELSVRLRRTIKENEDQTTRMLNDNGALRNQIQQNDVRNRQKINELTQYFQVLLQKQRTLTKENIQNRRVFFQAQLSALKQIIDAKQSEIKRLLQLNSSLRSNEQRRLRQINENNANLKQQLQERTLHYEREIELMKIKISQLYQADIQALRSQLKNAQSLHSRQAQNIRNLLKQTQLKLASEVQAKLDLRKHYQLRLTEMTVIAERNKVDHINMLTHAQKQLQGQQSNISLSHIEHHGQIEQRNQNMKGLMNEKRNLQKHIQTKNKEIQALNLRIQKMMGLHKRDIEKLEADLATEKNDHQKWLERQHRENGENEELKNGLTAKIDTLNKSIQANSKKNKINEESLRSEIDKKQLENAKLNGLIEELKKQVNSMHSRELIEQSNIERTQLETKVLIENEKEKLFETVKKEKNLTEQGHADVRKALQDQIHDLKHENDILQDNYRKAQIREQQLKNDVRTVLDSVNQRNKLQEHVINIGLSNNYFKNVAEVFKKTLSS